jgi:hypothetical protein
VKPLAASVVIRPDTNIETIHDVVKKSIPDRYRSSERLRERDVAPFSLRSRTAAASTPQQGVDGSFNPEFPPGLGVYAMGVLDGSEFPSGVVEACVGPRRVEAI